MLRLVQEVHDSWRAAWAPTSGEVKDLRPEVQELKVVLVEQALDLRLPDHGWGDEE